MELSDPTKQRKTIASVLRALDILDLFDSKHAEWNAPLVTALAAIGAALLPKPETP